MLCIIYFVIAGLTANGQSDFTVTCSSPNISNGLIKPMKAGSSFQFQVSIRNNKKVTYTASIDKNAMPYGSWVQIDNNSQSLAPDKTVTFLLTIAVPAGTSDVYTYSFPFYFNAYDSNNNNNPYTWGQLTLIVDNSPPLTPNVSVSSKTSSSITIYFNSSDARSSEYTNTNTSAGVDGIKSYTLLLKDSNGNTIGQPYSKDATEISFYYTFNGLAGYTEYNAFVTAVDLAGNSKTSPSLIARTKVGAMAGINATSITYCSATLNWAAAGGATSYRISTSTDGANPIVATSTSLPITGLTANTRYTYYLSAVGAEGEGPRVSYSFSTLAVPAPIVTGSATICSSSATYTVTNLPAGCSVSWGDFSNLGLSSASGATATLNATGNGVGFFTATINSCGGSASSPTKVWIGSPSAPSIVGPRWINCGVEEIYTEENRMSVQWSISSPFRIIGGSDGSKCNIQAPSESSNAWLYATATNTCGSNTSEFEIGVNCDYYTVFPNPASSELNVLQTDEFTNSRTFSSKKDKSITAVRVVDKFGKTVFFQKYSNGKSEVKVNTSSLKSGLYLVIINSDKEQETHTILKQ